MMKQPNETISNKHQPEVSSETKDSKKKKGSVDSCDIAKLKEYYDIAYSQYAAEQKRMKLLDAVDATNIWRALKMTFPKYQILPDTNFVTYVKSNLLASIYTVTKSPQVLATSDEDKELCMRLNIALERIWSMSRVGLYQMKAGERAALMNMGITQVGWDNSLTGGSGDSFYKGNVVLKNIDPIKFMRDPYATSLDDAKYCLTIESYHKSILMENPNYREALKSYSEFGSPMSSYTTYIDTPSLGAAKNYYTLIIFWVKQEDGTINEYHTVNLEKIIYQKTDIKPSAFPFAILNCNIVPDGKLIGTSEPMKIFANYVAYNILDSVAMTAEFKNQNPPKFINSQSGLDIFQFSKYSDDPGKTFIVNGDASKAVHYHEYPLPSTNIPKYKQDTSYNIQLISGVDGRYTGRDTGSVITTGGVEDMLNRVTLIDTPKITLYEDYALQLGRLVLSNFVEFSNKRSFFVKDPQKPNTYKTVEVDFPDISEKSLFQYEINISSDLPKNKARIAETANQLMEKQMQYNKQNGGSSGVQLITEEEWLELQDLPFKERMMQRMGMQREIDMVEQVTQTIFQYSDLVQQGMDPQAAVEATANTLNSQRQGLPLDSSTAPMAVAQQSSPSPEQMAMAGQQVGGDQQPPFGGTMPELL